MHAWPRGSPRNSQMSLASLSLAVPEKIFHFSSCRARTGLRSGAGFCCAADVPLPSLEVTVGGTTLVLVAASIACHTPLHLVWLYAGLKSAVGHQPSALSFFLY